MKRKQRLTLWLVCGTILLMFIIKAFPYTEPYFHIERDDFLNGWQLKIEGSNTFCEIDLPYYTSKNQSGNALIIKKQLPHMYFPDPYLRIGSSQQLLSISIDDDVIYTFNSMADINNQIPAGASWRIIPLPQDCFGKTIMIQLTSQFGKTSGVISSIDFGPKDRLIAGLLQKDIIGLIIGLSLFSLSGFIVVVTILLKKKSGINYQGFYLAGVIVCVAIWFFGESQGYSYIYNNFVMNYYIQFLALFVMPVFLFQFIAQEYQLSCRQGMVRLADFHLFLLTLFMLLQLMGWGQFFQIQWVFLTVFCLSLGICIYLLLKEAQGQKRLKELIAILAVIMVAIGLDTLLYQTKSNVFHIDFILLGTIVIESIVAFSIVNRFLELLKSEFARQYLAAQVESQVKHYRLLEEKNTNIARFYHDMKNHWMVMENLAGNGELAEARKYSQQMINTISMSAKERFYTGNPILDALLAEKIYTAKNMGIEVSEDILIVKDIKLDVLDWCIIFGNSLDNAIEACSKLSSNKKITIKMVSKENMLICKIVNTYDRQIIISEDFKTTKTTGFHGYGVSNMRNTVEKYGGKLMIKYDEGIFELSFVLFDV